MNLIEIIGHMKEKILDQASILPTKLFLGSLILVELQQEIIKAGRFDFPCPNEDFLEMKIITTDSFGNPFPVFYIGMC